MRIILYTGKGGVGKTSVAAATALKASRAGHKTIIISTDAAHSLADSLDMKLGGEAMRVADNLWAQEPDIGESIKAHWGTVQEWLAAIMAWRGLSGMVAEEMAVLPGMEELTNLLYITDYHRKGDFQTIIVDCAPTGETLRLLGFPEVLKWWMDKLFPIERKAASLLRPLAKRVTDIPFPEDKVFAAAEDLFARIDEMHRLLTDNELTSVRLVVNPEKMVIKEAQRTYTYLNLYGYHTDMVVCNRVIPAEVKDGYFDAWKRIQRKHQLAIEEAFAPVPIFNVPLFEQEVVGLKMLEAMGQAVFGDEDPAKIFYKGKAHEIEKRDGYYVLSLALPFTSREEVSLLQNGDELVITVGKYRRNIILPRALLGMAVTEAKYADHALNIKFEHRPAHAEAGKETATGTKSKSRAKEGSQ